MLIALAEPDTVATVRQLKGLQALMALAEPDMTVLPFAGASVRLRYTGPLEQAYWRPLESSSEGGDPAASRFRKFS